ncbi:hypothetical protein HU200_058851 [Digitaria exilis]|uniref:Protein gamma response 1 n=1 Tax=Digitaria exilis TaxID=1010633 RepID=A0A835E3R8_9POAL|nr:hypothetical protein HU200_058851 [Digitaria exilis]
MEGKVLSVDCGGGAGDAADDLKYISGLSTILVATIQEVKDQVSQMEFIFCSQLFPHIQAKAKLVQARLDDAMTAKEDEWRKREASLVSQLEELSSGKRQAEERLLRIGSSLEEMKGKLADSERMAARHESEKKQLLGRLEDEMRKGEVIRRLQREIEEKAAEVTREREANQRLLQQVDLKDKDLLLEQSKRRDLIEDYTKLKTNYKQLKSQYNFLLGKIDQNEGSKSHALKNTTRNPTPEEAQALAASPPQDMEFNNSDDETQDMNNATQGPKNIPSMPAPKQQSTISVHPPKKDFKYRESVRKKADRENLKGVECKQCKKFYDAVLPDGHADGDGAGSTSLRCEHHDGVSRHRQAPCLALVDVVEQPSLHSSMTETAIPRSWWRRRIIHDGPGRKERGYSGAGASRGWSAGCGAGDAGLGRGRLLAEWSSCGRRRSSTADERGAAAAAPLAVREGAWIGYPIDPGTRVLFSTRFDWLAQ